MASAVAEDSRRYLPAGKANLTAALSRKFDGFDGNSDDEVARRYVLDIFDDKVYLYKDGLIITFRSIDDKQEFFDEVLEMMEERECLADCVNDPEAYMESGSVAA